MFFLNKYDNYNGKIDQQNKVKVKPNSDMRINM